MPPGVRGYDNIPWRQATEVRSHERLGESKRTKMLKTGGWLRAKVSTPLQRPTRKRLMQRNKKSGDRAASHQRTWGWWLRYDRESEREPPTRRIKGENGDWRLEMAITSLSFVTVRREHGMEGTKAVAVSSTIEGRPKIEVLSWRVATYSPAHGTIRTSHTPSTSPPPKT
jgi:hypothetical protein